MPALETAADARIVATWLARRIDAGTIDAKMAHELNGAISLFLRSCQVADLERELKELRREVTKLRKAAG